MLCGPEGGGGAAGEEIPRHGHPGAPGPHRAHTDPAAEEGEGQSINTSRPPSAPQWLMKNDPTVNYNYYIISSLGKEASSFLPMRMKSNI